MKKRPREMRVTIASEAKPVPRRPRIEPAPSTSTKLSAVDGGKETKKTK